MSKVSFVGSKTRSFKQSQKLADVYAIYVKMITDKLETAGVNGQVIGCNI